MNQTTNRIDQANLSEIVRFLNSPKRTERPRAVEMILDWLWEGGSLTVAEKRAFRAWRSGRPTRQAGRTVRHHLVNQILRRYTLYPQLEVGPKGFAVRWMSEAHAGQQPDDAEMVRMLLTLAERGLLPRIRVCPGCRRWFQGPPKKKYHSFACRKRTFNHNPRYLAWKKNYMKDFMRRKRKAEKEQDREFFKTQGRSPARHMR